MRKVFGFVFAFMLLVGLAAATITPVVVAQSEVVPVAPETTFGWVAFAWLIYAVAGLVASVTKTPTEPFDPIKFARSLLIMLLTGVIALAFRISPANVETQFGGLITTMANVIVNTAPGVTLIYLTDKLYKFVMNAKAKIEAAHTLSTPRLPK